MKLSYDILKEGGEWMGALRERVKRVFHNGEDEATAEWMTEFEAWRRYQVRKEVESI